MERAFGSGGGTSEQGPPPPRPHRQEEEARSLLWPSITRNQGLPGIVLSMIWGQIIVIWELIWLSMCLFGPHSPPCLQEPGFPVLLETPKPGPFLLPWGLAISLLPPCPLPMGQWNSDARTSQSKPFQRRFGGPLPVNTAVRARRDAVGTSLGRARGATRASDRRGLGSARGALGRGPVKLKTTTSTARREREEPRPDLFVPSLCFDDSIHLLFPSPFSFYWGAAPLLFEDCPRMPSQHSHSSCPCLRTRVPLCLSSANAVSN